MHVSVGASEGYFLSKLMTIYFTEGDLCMFKKGSNSVPKLGSQRAKNKYQKCPPFRVPKIVRNMVRKLTKNGPKLVQKWCRFWFPKLEPKSDFGHVFGTTFSRSAGQVFPARPDGKIPSGRGGKTWPEKREKVVPKTCPKIARIAKFGPKIWNQNWPPFWVPKMTPKTWTKIARIANSGPKFGTKAGPRFWYQK